MEPLSSLSISLHAQGCPAHQQVPGYAAREASDLSHGFVDARWAQVLSVQGYDFDVTRIEA